MVQPFPSMLRPVCRARSTAPIRRGRGATTVALRPLWSKDGPTITFYPPTGTPSAERGAGQERAEACSLSLTVKGGGSMTEHRRNLVRTLGPNSLGLQ